MFRWNTWGRDAGGMALEEIQLLLENILLVCVRGILERKHLLEEVVLFGKELLVCDDKTFHECFHCCLSIENFFEDRFVVIMTMGTSEDLAGN